MTNFKKCVIIPKNKITTLERLKEKRFVMKRRGLLLLVSALMAVLAIFALAACSKTEAVEKSEIIFKSLTVTNTDVSGTVSNATDEFSFAEEIEVKGGARFEVSNDEYGLATYLTKKAPLEVGQNVFYVFEMNGEEIVQTYTVTIYRKHIYTVTVYPLNGDEEQTQTLEEGEFASEPQTDPEREGYTFDGWNYDFSQAVIRDTEIVAKWLPIFTIDSGVLTGLTEHGQAMTDVKIPAMVDGIEITEIGKSAFENNTCLTSVLIPESVESIQWGAFKGCSLLERVIGGTGLKTIDHYAFADCVSLESVEISNGVTYIGAYAFKGCSNLTEIALGTSVMKIGGYAFANCVSLESVEISKSVTEIGAYAFAFCSSLTDIVIGDSVQVMGSSVFQECTSLKRATIGNGVTKIGG